MSPALLNKYLQAARQVADHMVLKPDGIDFAPHPMLAETDRDRYAIQRILDFYRASPPITPTTSRPPGGTSTAPRSASRRARSPTIAAEAKVSAKYLATDLETPRRADETGQTEVGPVAKLQAMWRALPAPAADQPEMLRAKRDRDARLRGQASAATRRCSSPRRVSRAAGRLAAAAELEAAPVNLHRREFDPRGAAQRHRSGAGRPADAALSRTASGSRAALGGADGAGARGRHGSGGARRRARPLRSLVRALRLRVPGRLLRQRTRPLFPRRFRRQGTLPQRRLSQRDGILARRRAAHGTRFSTRRARSS